MLNKGMRPPLTKMAVSDNMFHKPHAGIDTTRYLGARFDSILITVTAARGQISEGFEDFYLRIKTNLSFVFLCHQNCCTERSVIFSPLSEHYGPGPDCASATTP